MTVDPLSNRAQALLDAARDGLGPDDAAIARMRDKVLAGAGGIGVAAGTAKAGMSLASKLTIVSLVAAVVGGGAWWMLRGSSSGSGSGSGSGSATPVALSEVPKAPSRRADSIEAAVAVAPDLVAAAKPVAPNEAPKEPSRKAHATAPSKSRSPSLADEVALVDDAMAALRRDDPSAALAAADDHVARFGARGQLAEEASAIRVESLCRLGDSRWSSALDAFDAHWPRSAQRPRLSVACKGVQ